MKRVPLLLALSLAANAALLGVLFARPALVPPAFRDFFDRGATARRQAEAEATVARARAAAAQAKMAEARPTTARENLWTSLRTDDLPALIARLRAEGFPPAIVRAIVGAEIGARFNARWTELAGLRGDIPFWKSDQMLTGWGSDMALFAKMNQLYREQSRLARELFGDDFFTSASGDATAEQRRQFGGLPKAKVDLLQRINDDYDEMTSQLRTAMQGIVLPEDREKLALLEREKRADIAAALTPEQLADYVLHASPMTERLRPALTIMEATEDEFRAVQRIRQAFLSRVEFPEGTTNITAEMRDQRSAAQRQMAAELKSALGDARYADYTRASTPEYQQLIRLTQTENLPRETAVRAFAFRDTASTESNRIVDDTALEAAQKQAALKTLAQNTRAQIISTLGPAAGNAYVEVASGWLTTIERGNAVTFNLGSGYATRRATPAPGPAQKK